MNDNRCALSSIANLAVHPSLGVHAPYTSPLRVLCQACFEHRYLLSSAPLVCTRKPEPRLRLRSVGPPLIFGN